MGGDKHIIAKVRRRDRDTDTSCMARKTQIQIQRQLLLPPHFHSQMPPHDAHAQACKRTYRHKSSIHRHYLIHHENGHMLTRAKPDTHTHTNERLIYIYYHVDIYARGLPDDVDRCVGARVGTSFAVGAEEGGRLLFLFSVNGFPFQSKY